MNKSKVVLLFSGGIDSTVLYYWLNDANFDVFPIHINYGQTTYLGEINAIKELILDLGEFIRPPFFIEVPGLRQIGSGTLVGEFVSDNYSIDKWNKDEFFPNRNMIFISIAASYAFKIGVHRIAIGVVGENTYSDTRSSFINSITTTLSESLADFEIIVPFVDHNRKLVLDESIRLNVPIEKTFSCNCLGDRHCLLCNSCLDRQHALEWLGKQNAF
ncbi:7-cyano-7-deazaguanine synthase [Paenibacillus senegalimassiliensis]|uniref:7-cyano-7-deazaguanine synthase n=1 Tax=Paenibacillus senegalimassiliensis TaxID=1737426 RepID=UPI00073FA229|nr:7-cyano-7-deazaguanine synthase [Paenibacillus senegalimassiliensis]